MHRRIVEILTHPNPALKQIALEVDPVRDHGLPELIQTMTNLMYEDSGIGLAAPQIGVQKRVVVFDLEEGLTVLCNPRFSVMSEETAVEDEGCLSVPGIAVPVERSTHVVCDALDENGESVRIEATDLMARMLQHEIDHLDGLLMIDRATPDERKAAIRRYNEVNTPR